MEKTLTTEHLTVPEMVRELGGKVSADQVRTLCRNGRIKGAVNKGSGDRAYFIVPRGSFEAFKKSGPEPLIPEQRTRTQVYRDKSGVNLLGI